LSQVVITTQGVAFLNDAAATVGAEGLPLHPTPYSTASLYPGIWTTEDAQAALLVYRQWNEREGEIGRYWIGQVEAAQATQPAILANIDRLTGYRVLVDAVLQAIADHAPLPRWALPVGDPVADELAKLLRAMAPFPSDLLDEAGGWFKQQLTECRDRFERTCSHWREVLEQHQRLQDQVLVLLQSQPVADPPFIFAVHDGQHILDQPECYTIGAGREKATVWLN
jgi:hypothetical protein